jgi:hypothetical protein
MAITNKPTETAEQSQGGKKKPRLSVFAKELFEREKATEEQLEVDPRHEVHQRLEKRFPRNLHKEHWQEGEVDQNKKKRGPKRTKTAAPKLQSTLYNWWWEFQRAARDFPKVREDVIAKSEAHAEALAKNDRYFGELGDDFLKWWDAGGHAIFREEDIPLISVLAPKTLGDKFIEENGVILIIPMTISRELIHKQLDEVLEVYHPGDKLKRHKFSTADRPIYSEHRYRTTDFSFLIEVWRRKQKKLKSDTDDSWWEIYCDATGDELLKTKLEGNNANNVGDKIHYAKRAKEAFDQASELIRNALIGEFPKDDAYQARKKREKGRS